MVKPKTGDARSGNTYWRLDYASFNIESLQERARAAGYPAPANKARVASIVSRVDRQLPNYRQCDLEELKQFAFDRSLVRDKDTIKNLKRTALMQLLEVADDQVQFFRFMDLPPELRFLVYEWNMASFPKKLETPVQPPLTRVSKLLRKESTPAFYQNSQFMLYVRRRHDLARSTISLAFSRDSHHFLVAIGPENVAELRRFRISVAYTSWDTCALDLELKTTDKGLVPSVKADEVRSGFIGRREDTEEVPKVIEDAAKNFFAKRMEKAESRKRTLMIDDLYGLKKAWEQVLILE